MGKNLFKCTVLSCCLMASATLSAQTTHLLVHKNPLGVVIKGLSPNGKWATGGAGSGNTSHPLLWNLETDEKTYLYADEGEGIRAAGWDVTNDGLVVVGNYENVPGYYKDGSWNKLPIPENCDMGEAKGISADGTVIVGYAGNDSKGVYYACKWVDFELTDVQMPETDAYGNPVTTSMLNDVSADGNTFWGVVNPVNLKTYTPVVWKPNPEIICEDIYYNDEGKRNYTAIYETVNLSPNGKFMTGYVDYDLGEENIDACFFYDVDQQKTEVYYNEDKEAEIKEFAGFCVDNNGVIYESAPARTSVVRKAYIRIEGTQTLLTDYLKQEYDFDITANSSYNDLGTVIAVSEDCKTLIGFEGPAANWCLKLNKVPGGYPDAIDATSKAEASIWVNNGILSITGNTEHIILTDASGKVILNQDVADTNISLNGMAKGMYIATLRTEGENIIKKIFVK